MRRLVPDDVAYLETQPLRVSYGAARDFDLALVEIDPEHTTLFGPFPEQAGEQPVTTPEVHDEPLFRNEALHEGEVRQERTAVNEEPRAERRGPIPVDRSVEGCARASARHQGTRQRTVSLPKAV